MWVGYMPIYTHAEARKRQQISFSMTLHLTALRQGLSLEPEIYILVTSLKIRLSLFPSAWFTTIFREKQLWGF